MVGKYNESQFDEIDYEEFYEHHNFQPIPDERCTRVHEAIPRFGWGYDQIQELGAKTMLDIGCLDGSFVLSCVNGLGVKAKGIDLTKDGITLANERAKERNLDAEFYQGYAEEWLEKFAEQGETFDLITAFEILEHVADPQHLIELMDKVLAPGGRVLISTPAFESPRFGLDDEQNKCHVRLYTTKPENYTKVNKYGNERLATSIIQEIGEDRIEEYGVYNELINLKYK